jgi:hypothetical protein
MNRPGVGDGAHIGNEWSVTRSGVQAGTIHGYAHFDSAATEKPRALGSRLCDAATVRGDRCGQHRNVVPAGFARRRGGVVTFSDRLPSAR